MAQTHLHADLHWHQVNPCRGKWQLSETVQAQVGLELCRIGRLPHVVSQNRESEKHPGAELPRRPLFLLVVVVVLALRKFVHDHTRPASYGREVAPNCQLLVAIDNLRPGLGSLVDSNEVERSLIFVFFVRVHLSSLFGGCQSLFARKWRTIVC